MTLPRRDSHREGSRLVPNGAQPRILSKHPWCDVVFIETRTGPRGGEDWLLTLACGHRVFRPFPKASLRMFVSRLRLAPKRVRCIICSYEKVA